MSCVAARRRSCHGNEAAARSTRDRYHVSVQHTRRRRPTPAESLDRSLEAQLETELSVRRAERHAVRLRTSARRTALLRFCVALLVLSALVGAIGLLVFDGLSSVL